MIDFITYEDIKNSPNYRPTSYTYPVLVVDEDGNYLTVQMQGYQYVRDGQFVGCGGIIRHDKPFLLLEFPTLYYDAVLNRYLTTPALATSWNDSLSVLERYMYLYRNYEMSNLSPSDFRRANNWHIVFTQAAVNALLQEKASL